MISKDQISGLILAGGRGMRMGGVNKGLQILRNEPMVAHVLRRLAPQLGQISINANQDLDLYEQFGCPVISDVFSGYAGPLAGLHAGLTSCSTAYLATVPCDSPFLPTDLIMKLAQSMQNEQAQLAVAVTPASPGEERHWQQQPVFCLVKSELKSHLASFLSQGGRKVSDWYADLHIVEVPFTDIADFRNINTRAELEEHTFDQGKV